jgi:hypothetical protein
VLLLGSQPIGYFKTKDACINAFRQSVIAFADDVRPHVNQANNTTFAVCAPVKTQSSSNEIRKSERPLGVLFVYHFVYQICTALSKIQQQFQ